MFPTLCRKPRRRVRSRLNARLEVLEDRRLLSTYLFQTVDDPLGVRGTDVERINDAGQIVGAYTDSSGNLHGFLTSTDGSTYTTIDDPLGVQDNASFAINNTGQIVGYYSDSSGNEHAYLRSADGSYTTVDDPLGVVVQGVAYGINDAGQIIGGYTDSSGMGHGFLRSADGSTYTTIDDPLGVTFTEPHGTNDAGQIVGTYGDSSGVDHGFLRSADGSTYTTIDDPLGVRGTAINEINAAGDLVGLYYDSAGESHGFIASPANISGQVVTNTADSGPGSLRQAILNANANDSVPVTISFNIPTTDPGYANGVFTIQPLSQLPVLLQNITIDGTTQTVFTGNTNPYGPVIVLNGAKLASGTGLELNNSNTVKDLDINGFQGTGISMSYSFASNGITNNDNQILDNYIGTDPTGTIAVPNGGGIGIVGWGSPSWQSTGNLIQGNLISGNLFSGIVIGDANQTQILDNLIGTDRTGTANLGNGADGIGFDNAGAPSNTIEGNTIAFNGRDGIVDAPDYRYSVAYTTSGHQGNAFLQNSIFSNGMLGIDLLAPGTDGNVDAPQGVPLQNTPGGPHQGANLLQNYPVLSSAISSTSSTVITGLLNSTPSETFLIEFFASPTANASGYGEGQTYLGAASVTTDTSGNASFTVTLPVTVPVGNFISSTATDPGNNTSEFSRDQVVSSSATIGDAGFEQVVVGAGQFQYRPKGSAWTFAGNAGISGNDSGFTSGNPAAPQGSQVAFIQGTGSVTQSVAGWNAGSYTISFDAAQRDNFGTSVENFEVLVDGNIVGTFKPTGTSYQTYTTAAFTVTAGAHTIEFLGLDTAGGDNTAFLDAVSLATATTRTAPTVGDSGFETVQVGAGQFQYRPKGSAWTFAGNAGISGNDSAFTSGNPAAPQGTQVAFIQGTGSFTQSVGGWAAGTYTISFDAAQRGNNGTSVENFEVLVDGNVVGTFKPTGTSYQSYTTAVFTVTAGAHTIEFLGLDTAGGDNTAFLDAVSLATATTTTVPTVGDSGFESVLIGAGNFAYDPTGSAWTFAGTAGISGNGSGFTSGNPAAPQGSQVAFIQGTGSITQSVGGWAAGSYTISFDAAQRGNFGSSVENFEVLVDGNVVGTFKPTGTSYQTYTTAAFTVTAGAHTIEFLGLDTAGGDNTAFLDAVSVATATI